MKNLFFLPAVIFIFLSQGCYFTSSFGVGSASGSIEGPTVGPYATTPKKEPLRGTWMEGKRVVVSFNRGNYYWSNNEEILAIVRDELRNYFPVIIVPEGDGYGSYGRDSAEYDYKVVVTASDRQSKKVVYLEVVAASGASGGSASGEARDFSYRSYRDQYYDSRISDEEWHFIAWRNAVHAAARSLSSLKIK